MGTLIEKCGLSFGDLHYDEAAELATYYKKNKKYLQCDSNLEKLFALLDIGLEHLHAANHKVSTKPATTAINKALDTIGKMFRKIATGVTDKGDITTSNISTAYGICSPLITKYKDSLSKPASSILGSTLTNAKSEFDAVVSSLDVLGEKPHYEMMVNALDTADAYVEAKNMSKKNNISGKGPAAEIQFALDGIIESVNCVQRVGDEYETFAVNIKNEYATRSAVVKARQTNNAKKTASKKAAASNKSSDK